MRISDWSSYVCSSDLRTSDVRTRSRCCGAGIRAAAQSLSHAAECDADGQSQATCRYAGFHNRVSIWSNGNGNAGLEAGYVRERPLDRKSVVSEGGCRYV